MMLREVFGGMLFVAGLCAIVIGSVCTAGAILFIILDEVSFLSTGGNVPSSLIETFGISLVATLLGAIALMLSPRILGRSARNLRG